MRRVDSFILSLNRQFVIWAMGLMAILVFSNVVLRYFLDESILWADETSRYLMIWATFLGSGILFRQGAHIAVDNLQDFFPGFGGKVVRFLIIVILMSFFFLMIYIGFRYVLFQWNQVTPVTRIPFGFVYAAMPVGFLLMAYHLAMIARTWITDRHIEEQSGEKLFTD